MSEPRTRWITIGQLQTPFYVIIRNCGFPGGYIMHWRGGLDPFQPLLFARWSDLLSAIRHRLRLSGLKLVELQRVPGELGEYVRVRVMRITSKAPHPRSLSPSDREREEKFMKLPDGSVRSSPDGPPKDTEPYLETRQRLGEDTEPYLKQ